MVKANKEIQCKKSLYKSTYKGYAFNINKKYFILEEDDKFIYVIDNKKQAFSFVKNEEQPFYLINDYFKI